MKAVTKKWLELIAVATLFYFLISNATDHQLIQICAYALAALVLWDVGKKEFKKARDEDDFAKKFLHEKKG